MIKYLFACILLLCPFQGFSGSTSPKKLPIPKAKPKPPVQDQAKSRQSYITYALSGGRFGDNLLAFMHAKWFSYRFKMPLLYKPFPYSDQLQLSVDEQLFRDGVLNKVSQSMIMENLIHPKIKNDTSMLYIVPFYSECLNELAVCRDMVYLPIDWENEEFRNLLKKAIKPIANLPPLDLPRDKITVAVHIRMGGGYDTSNTPAAYPYKFPSLEYFIQQLQFLSHLFSGQSLYVHIFTDDQNPQNLLKEIEERVNDSQIEYHCRQEGNNHYSNIVEDFFAMTQFDCLIRGDSNFAVAADKITDYKVVVYPVQSIWDGHRNVVHKAGVKFHGSPWIRAR
jgi:hypothetical protein